MSHRPTICGTRHAVSAGHYLAAAAGFTILEAGGNAIDAGCAAGIALGVLQPDLVNFAGVAPIMLRLADGTVESIAGLGWWPKRLPADLFMREHGGKIPDGVLRTVIPAAPDAWITALRRHGTMRFADIAAPAIRFAAEGFSVYPLLAASIASHAHEYRRWQSNTAIYLPGGRDPKGRRQIRPDRSGAHHPVHGRPGPRRRPRPPCRSRRRPPRLLPWRHRPRDRPLPATGRRLPRGRRPRRIPLPDRAGGPPHLARPRTDHLRPLVPGAGLAAGARPGRTRRHRRPGTQLARLPAPHRRVPEPRDGRPRIPLRRPRLHRRADRPPARPRHHRPPRRRRARRPGVRPDARPARPPQHAPRGVLR